eukprot:TRINITY_DN14666_c0_g1_i1.p1 TRINITY_DN14666_c0_g1~~TRINITY_DN14666_c0_g1_i1.p1  ORF type:complete len:301 (+),score=77.92 TRINITY_DN14666_c0_g1_i1:70-972(+)
MTPLPPEGTGMGYPVGLSAEVAAVAPAPQDDGPERHPLVVAMKALLKTVHGPRGGRLGEAVQEAASLAHDAVSAGASGDLEHFAAGREPLDDALETAERRNNRLEGQLKSVWAEALAATAAADSDTTAPQPARALGVAEVEELALAHLCAYPEFLSETLLTALLQQVTLGQALLETGSRGIDATKARRFLQQRLPRHRPKAATIAAASCEHLMAKSETIAVRLLQRMDLDGDGVVNEKEFCRTAINALTVEVQNVALAAGTQSLLSDVDFADDFHEAMAHSMGLDDVAACDAAIRTDELD